MCSKDPNGAAYATVGDTPLEGMKGFQRKYLRGLAHSRKPVVQVGKEGVTDAVAEAVEAALLDHELIKVRLIRPPDKKEMAAELARRASAELCGLVGHMAILYRQRPDKPTIVLPERVVSEGAGDEPREAEGEEEAE